MVQIDDQSDPPASLTDILTGYITSAHMLVNGSTTDESALKTTIGGEPAQAYRVAGTRQDGSPVSSIIVVVIHKNQIYSFIALADANPMPNYNDIQAILATVTFQT